MRSKQLQLPIVAGLIPLIAVLTGCVNNEQEKTTTPPAPPNTTVTAPSAGGPDKSAPTTEGKHFVVGFAQANSKDPYRQVQNAALKKAAETYPDITLDIQDAADNSETQIGQIETFLTKKVDLLLVSPNEAAPLTPVIGKVYDAHIPVVLMERGINSDKYTAWIGGDNKEIGEEAGKFVIDRTKGDAKIVEIEGKADATPTKDRSDGFHDAIHKSPDLVVVDHYNCDYQREPARKYMENLLQKHTDFNVIYAHNDEMALGAILALKAAGKDPKNYIIVGIDGVQKEAIQAIQAGEMSATFKYNWLGQEALDTAHKILTGSTVEKKIILSTELVTKDNAADYLAHLPQ